jgi:uncharacterized protein (TIGR00369 family)
MGTPPNPRTHQAIEARLCGEPRELREGYSRVVLTPGEEMRADEYGLVHGGFVFGLADYAAMLAVNHPTVVLGSAQSRFLRPVVVGGELIAEATVVGREGRKRIVAVDVEHGGEVVFRGDFVCFLPDRHVLAGDESR